MPVNTAWSSDIWGVEPNAQVDRVAELAEAGEREAVEEPDPRGGKRGSHEDGGGTVELAHRRRRGLSVCEDQPQAGTRRRTNERAAAPLW
jgi:hypothetical protein